MSDNITESINKAYKEIGELSAGKPWTMSIPVRPERDSDTIIGSALANAELRIKELEAQLAERVQALNAHADKIARDGKERNDKLAQQVAALATQRNEAEARSALLAKALTDAKMSHHVSEDCWYTCPMYKDSDGERGCCHEALMIEPECDCGADRHNAKIDAALTVSAQAAAAYVAALDTLADAVIGHITEIRDWIPYPSDIDEALVAVEAARKGTKK